MDVTMKKKSVIKFADKPQTSVESSNVSTMLNLDDIKAVPINDNVKLVYNNVECFLDILDLLKIKIETKLDIVAGLNQKDCFEELLEFDFKEQFKYYFFKIELFYKNEFNTIMEIDQNDDKCNNAVKLSKQPECSQRKTGEKSSIYFLLAECHINDTRKTRKVISLINDIIKTSFDALYSRPSSQKAKSFFESIKIKFEKNRKKELIEMVSLFGFRNYSKAVKIKIEDLPQFLLDINRQTTTWSQAGKIEDCKDDSSSNIYYDSKLVLGIYFEAREKLSKLLTETENLRNDYFNENDVGQIKSFLNNMRTAFKNFLLNLRKNNEEIANMTERLGLYTEDMRKINLIFNLLYDIKCFHKNEIKVIKKTEANYNKDKSIVFFYSQKLKEENEKEWHEYFTLLIQLKQRRHNYDILVYNFDICNRPNVDKNNEMRIMQFEDNIEVDFHKEALLNREINKIFKERINNFSIYYPTKNEMDWSMIDAD